MAMGRGIRVSQTHLVGIEMLLNLVESKLWSSGRVNSTKQQSQATVAFADKNLNLSQVLKLVFEKEKKIKFVGQRENAGKQYDLIFSNNFQKACCL